MEATVVMDEVEVDRPGVAFERMAEAIKELQARTEGQSNGAILLYMDDDGEGIGLLSNLPREASAEMLMLVTREQLRTLILRAELGHEAVDALVERAAKANAILDPSGNAEA